MMDLLLPPPFTLINGKKLRQPIKLRCRQTRYLPTFRPPWKPPSSRPSRPSPLPNFTPLSPKSPRERIHRGQYQCRPQNHPLEHCRKERLLLSGGHKKFCRLYRGKQSGKTGGAQPPLSTPSSPPGQRM